MSHWLGDVISNKLIAIYEGNYFTEDALVWLREKPRTFGELRAEEIDWLRWMAASTDDRDVLEKLSEDPDIDVRMWVACNHRTPELVLGKLAEDPVVFIRRGVAQNRSTPLPLLMRLNDDCDVVVRVLVSRNRERRSQRCDSSQERLVPGPRLWSIEVGIGGVGRWSSLALVNRGTTNGEPVHHFSFGRKVDRPR